MMAAAKGFTPPEPKESMTFLASWLASDLSRASNTTGAAIVRCLICEVQELRREVAMLKSVESKPISIPQGSASDGNSVG